LEWGFAASIALALTIATLIATHEPETIDMSGAVPDAKSRRSLGTKEN
jgi:hypothetical protein